MTLESEIRSLQSNNGSLNFKNAQITFLFNSKKKKTTNLEEKIKALENDLGRAQLEISHLKEASAKSLILKRN